MNEFKAMWLNYTNFTDRTSVRGYWMAWLINFVLGFALAFLEGVMSGIAVVSSLYSIAILVPSLAIAVRRLRDANLHWAWIFISIIPIVGQIIFIVLLCRPTTNFEGRQV